MKAGRVGERWAVVDVNVLIDAIVRQTTVLIAGLATATGGRAPLANTANQVFVDLVRELRAQGLGNKVIADMFGLALRTYHSRVRRLGESTTVRGRSLWEATYDYVREHESLSQHEVLERFRNDDEASVRGVLSDLVESGLVFRSGRGATARYRIVKAEELGPGPDSAEGAAYLVWVAVSRFGPASSDRIAEAVPLDRAEIEIALGSLTADGRVERVERDGDVTYRTDLCVIPLGTETGWEAAFFDHYQAVVTALCTKLRKGTGGATARDRIGGSTFALSVWEGHPHYDEVMGQLARMRSEGIALRERVSAYNRTHTPPDDAVRVISYMGQTLLEPDAEEERS
jgi:predicted nucleic acid-binding protein